MSAEVFGDASYFTALLNARDEYHDRATELALALDGSLVTTWWVLIEVANTLSKPQHRTVFVAWLESIRKHPEVVVLPIEESLLWR